MNDTTETPAPSRDGYDLPELEDLTVFPDQIRVGDYVMGYEITQLSKADHYRRPGVRLTLETDPELGPQIEVGRLVLETDRDRVHKLPIQRPLDYDA